MLKPLKLPPPGGRRPARVSTSPKAQRRPQVQFLPAVVTRTVRCCAFLWDNTFRACAPPQRHPFWPPTAPRLSLLVGAACCSPAPARLLRQRNPPVLLSRHAQLKMTRGCRPFARLSDRRTRTGRHQPRRRRCHRRRRRWNAAAACPCRPSWPVHPPPAAAPRSAACSSRRAPR